jgi:hypothetical protein
MRKMSMRTLALTLLVVAAGCDSGVTAPAPAPSGAAANRLILGSPTTVTVVTRNTPLAAPLSATATIGLFGGQIILPGTGLKVIVPPFALTSSKQITVTALAGNQVAYEFQPHGIQFLVPILISQNLVGTSANTGGLLNLNLKGGYFANASDLNPLAGTGLVSELLGTSISLLTKTVTFPAFHFSGYLVAIGEGSNSSSDSQ